MYISVGTIYHECIAIVIGYTTTTAIVLFIPRKSDMYYYIM